MIADIGVMDNFDVDFDPVTGEFLGAVSVRDDEDVAGRAAADLNNGGAAGP